MDDNGNPTRKDNGQTPANVATVTLRFDRATSAMQVDLSCANLDEALDMLSRAARTVEGEWRMGQLQRFQQRAADAALAERVRHNLQH